MAEKKKGLLKGLFGKSSGGGCGCGVTIVEEPKSKDDKGNEKKSK